MRSFFLIFLLLFSTFACDDGKRNFTETVTVTPSTPRGTVGGVVFDAGMDAPLANVNVTLVAGGQTFSATTNENGIFQVLDVPATGKVMVMYESEGFLPARFTAEFPQPVGNIPYENLALTVDPVWMFADSGVMQVRLLDPTGVPVGQVALQLNIPAAFYSMDTAGNMTFRGDVNRVANTNAMGLAQFRNLPELPLAGSLNFPQARVYVPEIDIDNDGNPEYASSTRIFDLHTSAGTVQVIRLNYYSAGDLHVVASNNAYFTGTPTVPGTFTSGDTIYLSFNREPDANTLSIVLREFEANGNSWPITPTINGSMVSFQLPDGLQAGEMYLLTVYAHAKNFGNAYTRTVPVFIHTNDPPTLTMTRENPMVTNSPVIVTFNQWVGTGSRWYNSLSGTNGVVYFAFDLNSSGIIGDDFAEYGYPSTNVSLDSMEDQPTWVPAYNIVRTGFSKRWRFQPPAAAIAGTEVRFSFPSVTNMEYMFRKPSGEPITVMTGNLP